MIIEKLGEPITLPELSLRWFYSCCGFDLKNVYITYNDNTFTLKAPLEKLYFTS